MPYYFTHIDGTSQMIKGDIMETLAEAKKSCLAFANSPSFIPRKRCREHLFLVYKSENEPLTVYPHKTFVIIHNGIKPQYGGKYIHKTKKKEA